MQPAARPAGASRHQPAPAGASRHATPAPAAMQLRKPGGVPPGCKMLVLPRRPKDPCSRVPNMLHAINARAEFRHAKHGAIHVRPGPTGRAQIICSPCAALQRVKLRGCFTEKQKHWFHDCPPLAIFCAICSTHESMAILCPVVVLAHTHKP